MKHPLQQNRRQAIQFLMIQLGLGSVVALGLGGLWDTQIAKSFMLGLFLDAIPSLIFILYAFRFGGAHQLKLITGSFYRGVTVKIAITAVLFIAIVKFVPVVFAALLSGFLMMKLSQLLRPIFY
jgi:ATP synthase protein I